jgi:hypothetical protein
MNSTLWVLNSHFYLHKAFCGYFSPYKAFCGYQNAIRRYHNKIITAVEFIEEVIRLSQKVISSDKEADELWFDDLRMHFTNMH